MKPAAKGHGETEDDLACVLGGVAPLCCYRETRQNLKGGPGTRSPGSKVLGQFAIFDMRGKLSGQVFAAFPNAGASLAPDLVDILHWYAGSFARPAWLGSCGQQSLWQPSAARAACKNLAGVETFSFLFSVE